MVKGGREFGWGEEGHGQILIKIVIASNNPFAAPHSQFSTQPPPSTPSQARISCRLNTLSTSGTRFPPPNRVLSHQRPRSVCIQVEYLIAVVSAPRHAFILGMEKTYINNWDQNYANLPSPAQSTRCLHWRRVPLTGT